jgi:4-alpha-glucanotransferase
MNFPRASGILLHPSSLPGAFGIGDLGPEAYRFADFLSASGQTLWQTLPLGPTAASSSPYACYSGFGGNPLLISPDLLISDGLLNNSDLPHVTSSATHVDFGAANSLKQTILTRAFDHHHENPDPVRQAAFELFKQRSADWLDDYALFRALKDANNGAGWIDWEQALKHGDSAALDLARERLKLSIERHKFSQFLFFEQWFALKAYGNERGIKFIGDVPIFVAYDSADVWLHRDLFKLDEEGKPTVVAGVPPDYFSATGQLWGNPLYNWDAMRADGFDWWIKRIRAALKVFDIVRLDHFRGFCACWEIPAGDRTAERGRWVEAPGRELFTSVSSMLPNLPLIAEDLGVITPEVEALRDDFDFPGMRILQFAFSGDADNAGLPHNYGENIAVYTGTHDNDTTVGWFRNGAGDESTRGPLDAKREREFCLSYLNSDGKEIHWDFIRAALASVANTAIVPLQDVLGLGSEARMNTPNTTEGNWSWRFESGALSDEVVRRLRALTESHGRAHPR